LFWSLGYLALRCLLQFVLLRPRSEGFKELEIVVLRHELSVLRRSRRSTRTGCVPLASERAASSAYVPSDVLPFSARAQIATLEDERAAACVIHFGGDGADRPYRR
jgi:hypothetical protein